MGEDLNRIIYKVYTIIFYYEPLAVAFFNSYWEFVFILGALWAEERKYDI